MSTVAFEKEVFGKALIACLPKRLFDSTEVLNLREKYLVSINGKKKFKKILSYLFGGRRKVQVTKSAFKDFMLVFFTVQSLSCSETTE